MKLNQNIQSSKGEMAYLVRESRHCNLSLGFDTQKRESVDAEIRSTVDYFLFTAQGSESLPRPLWFVYKFIKPIAINNLPRGSFAILTRRGSVGIGSFVYHEWHKKDNENILEELGMEVERPELKPEDLIATTQGTSLTKPQIAYVSPKPDEGRERVHADVCLRYFNGEGFTSISRSYGKAYADFARRIVAAHNRNILRNGFCPACKKFGNGLEKTILQRSQGLANNNPQAEQTEDNQVSTVEQVQDKVV
jgi:hypothetical protein